MVPAVDLLRSALPKLRIRVVNVVDLMTLQASGEHSHALSDAEFDAIFTKDKPIIFAFHGYPWLIHRLTYRRNNHANLHVRGYKEEGTTTTPFDMVVLNNMSRYHLAIEAIKRAGKYPEKSAATIAMFEAKLLEHAAYIKQHFEDMPEISKWKWTKP